MSRSLEAVETRVLAWDEGDFELLLQRSVDGNMLDEQGMKLMAHAQQERLFHVVDILSTYEAV